MDNKNNEVISKNYQQLIEIMKPKYGDSHGLFEIHQGNKTESINPKILLLGRENRGQGNKLKDNSGYKKPIVGDLGWLKDAYKFTKSPFWRVIGKYLHKSSDSNMILRSMSIFIGLIYTRFHQLLRRPILKNQDKCRELLV